MTSDRAPIPIDRAASRPASSIGFRLEADGPDACSDGELLALALSHGARAHRIAEDLLERFGSLADALRASPTELRLAGLTPRASLRLAAAAELGRRAARAWPARPWVIRTPADVAEPLLDEMASLEREELRVLLLDTKNVVTARRTVYRGNLAGSSVRVGEVFRDAVRGQAAAVAVVHNHPSGDPAPSGEDLRITAELAEAGRLLDIELLDHVILGRGRWSSLRALGVLGQGAATMR